VVPHDEARPDRAAAADDGDHGRGDVVGAVGGVGPAGRCLGHGDPLGDRPLDDPLAEAHRRQRTAGEHGAGRGRGRVGGPAPPAPCRARARRRRRRGVRGGRRPHLGGVAPEPVGGVRRRTMPRDGRPGVVFAGHAAESNGERSVADRASGAGAATPGCGACAATDAAPELTLPSGDTSLGLSASPLPVAEAVSWAVRRDCGAVVLFSGTARDHAPGRPGVARREYEAYESQVVPRLAAIAEEARARWPDVGRIALLHRTGVLAVGECAVVVVVSAPHREEAFAAARFGIDTLKRTVPIWKRETWAGGESWGLDAQHITDVEAPAP